MPVVTSRLIKAFPDAITAGVFLLLWVVPLRFGAHGVRKGMLTLLVEFMLVQASPLLASAARSTKRPRIDRYAGVACFGFFYLLFIALCSLMVQAWWPFLVFGWLFFSKVASMRNSRQLPMQPDWAQTTLLFLGAVVLAAILPVPRFGITIAIQPGLELLGSGIWAHNPHKVIACGTLYFVVLAILKWRSVPEPHIEKAESGFGT